MRIQKFIENVDSTKKLTISLAVLDDDHLLKKLKEFTVEIHTIEIHSACEVHKVLSVYSLPSCLKILRIVNNILNHEDIFALVKCLNSENSLQDLDLSRTKFEKNSFNSFISVLMNCSDLTKLSLTDSCLTKHEISSLILSLECMKSLKNIDLSKNNLRVLEIHGQLDNIISLDLSHSALQGNASIIVICKLQSLEELNLSHNHIRFFPLPNIDTQLNKLPINMKAILLSFNYMTPEDIGQLCFLIKSNLMKLNLDSNHIGNSIWSLSSLTVRFKHLKVLSLANTDVCVAVEGLAVLLSSVELEELNLSSNNLVLKDFRQLQSPLSNLTQLKKLNLSNNPEGAPALLQEILSSLKNLQDIRLSNTHMSGEDLVKISDLLESLRGLTYLDLSMNAIDSDGTRALANVLKKIPFLEGLDLSRLFIPGSDISVLWNNFVSLKVLKYLNLSCNQIDVNGFDKSLLFPPALEELIISNIIHSEKLFVKMLPLKNLRRLHLIDVRLRACDVEALAATLSSFSMLEEISLAHSVADSSIEKIFSAIKCLPNIKIIDFSGIKLPDVNELADMISSLSFLEELVLDKMFIENIDCEKFCDALVFMKSLSILNLHCAGKTKNIYQVRSRKLIQRSICFDCVQDTKQLCSGLEKLKYLKELSLKVSWDQECINLFAEVLPSLQLLEKFASECELFFIHGSEIGLLPALGRLIYLRDLELVMRKWIRVNGTNTLKALAQALSSLQLLEKLVLALTLDVDEGEDENGDDTYERQLFVTAVGKLKNLKQLELPVNIVSGKALAKVLASLPLLEKIWLIQFAWDCESEERIFHSLGKATYLKQFLLIDDYISQVPANYLVEFLPSPQLLETLVLRSVYWGEKLSLFVGELKYLRELHLQNVSIDERAFFNGSRSLYLLEKLVLKIPYYYYNQTLVFQYLEKLKYLKQLSLTLGRMTYVGDFVDSLSSLQLLEKITLKKIAMYNEIDEQLFASLAKLRFLKSLSLEMSTWYSGEGLVDALPSMQLLEKIKLKGFKFESESEKQLFSSIAKVRSLKKLSLTVDWCHNTLTEVDTLAEALAELKLLEKLSLRFINFTKGDQQLLIAIRSLSYLKELDLRRTTITQAS